MDWSRLFIPLNPCAHCGAGATRTVRWRVLPGGVGRLFSAEVGCANPSCPFRASYETIVLDSESASEACGAMVLGMSKAWNSTHRSIAQERAENAAPS